MHKGGGRWVGSNKLVELKKKKNLVDRYRLLWQDFQTVLSGADPDIGTQEQGVSSETATHSPDCPVQETSELSFVESCSKEAEIPWHFWSTTRVGKASFNDQGKHSGKSYRCWRLQVGLA